MNGAKRWVGNHVDELRKSLFLAKNVDVLSAEKLSIEQTSDFGAVQEAIAVVGKEYLTPHLDIDRNDFTPANCFWIIVSDSTGPVALSGCRLDDLAGEPVDQFWQRWFRRAYPGGVTEIAESLIDRLSGRICYMGDLYVREDRRGKAKLMSAAAAAAHVLVSLRWDPDVTFAFIREAHALRGAVQRYHFSQSVRFSKRFSDVHPGRTDDEVCAMLPRADLHHWIKSELKSSQQPAGRLDPSIVAIGARSGV